MALKFKKKASIRKNVKRLGQRLIKKSLDELKQGDQLEAVHEVRKRIKQLRALLRLVRGAMSRGDYRCLSRALREIAKPLGPARDARVKVEALADLIDHFREELAPRSFRQVKQVFAGDCRRQQRRLKEQHSKRRVAIRLKRLFAQFGSARFTCSGWSALCPGIKCSYREGRRSFRLARKGETSDSFHEWRKRVKDLYYQIGLLQPIWPEQMMAAEDELKRLGDYLGDDHDLYLITESETFKLLRKQAPEEARALEAFAQARKGKLRARAKALGARFYQDRPSCFCARLRQYWKKWRREPKTVVVS
jgi:CHAD domain-containing protein